MPVNWNGDKIITDMAKAAKLGVDQTLAACVVHAKENHKWDNRTGTLEGSIQMREAIGVGTRIYGRWGSFTVNYAIHQEIMNPFLTPATDVEYPKLAQRIREARGE